MPRLLLSRPLWAILALGAIAAVAYGAGRRPAPVTPEFLRAQSFEVVDGHNRLRARLCTDDQGHSKLELLNDHGQPQVLLQLRGNTPSLQLLDEKSVPRAAVLLSPEIGACLTITDAKGEPRIVAANTPDNRTVFALTSDKAPGLTLAVENSGATSFELGGSAEQAAISFRTDEHGSPRAVIRDHGSILWQLPGKE